MINKKSLKNLEKMGYFVRHSKKLFPKKHRIRRIFLYLCGLAIICGLFLGAYTVYLFLTLPSPENFGDRIVAQTTKIYDRTGEILLYEIHGDEKRTILTLEEIPDHVKKAVLAIEDAEFYNHPAFDLKAMFRGVIFNPLFRRTNIQGGSTITQQLVKNAFLTNERTVTRKIKEIILAIKMERNYQRI